MFAFFRSAASVLLVGIIFITQQSCFKSDAIQCEDGTWCALGMVCSVHFGSNVCVPEKGCGNHKKDTHEGCDDGNLNNGDGCSDRCESETCGNGIVEKETEQCDDGNRNDGDECRGDCGSNYRCNNGVVDIERGEECDPKDEETGSDCTPTCTLKEPGECGDNSKADNEECDPGKGTTEDPSRADGDSAECDSDCTKPMCGDGHYNPLYTYEHDPDGPDGPFEHEECDESGNTPTCDEDCTKPYCGDGVKNPKFRPHGPDKPTEECDPGTGNNDKRGNATNDSMNCDRDCSLVQCGDGLRNEVAEECEPEFTGDCDRDKICDSSCHCVAAPSGRYN